MSGANEVDGINLFLPSVSTNFYHSGVYPEFIPESHPHLTRSRGMLAQLLFCRGLRVCKYLPAYKAV